MYHLFDREAKRWLGSRLRTKLWYASAMDERELQVSEALLTARPVLRRAVPVLLLALDAMLIAAGLFGFLRFAQRSAEYERVAAVLSKNIVHYGLLAKEVQPPVPVVSDATVLTEKDGSLDLVAKVKNPSTLWAVNNLAYTFLVNGTAAVTGTTTLLPGEEHFLVALNQKVSSVPANPTLTLTFGTGDWVHATANQHLPVHALTVENPAYTVLTPGAKPLSAATATVRNTSIDSIPQANVVAALYNGTAIVGVAQNTLTDIGAFESRAVDLRFVSVQTVSSVTVSVSLPTLPIVPVQ